MNTNQEQKIKELISKYNDILLVSMRLAIAEDFVNLLLLNRDDTEFELSNLMESKEEFYTIILKEFLKKNSSTVVEELKFMEDPMPNLKKRFGKK